MSESGSVVRTRLSRLGITSIRGQLTLGIAAALVPCLGLGFFAVQRFVYNGFVRLTEKRLEAEAELISYGLREWGKGTSRMVQAFGVSPAFRDADIPEIQSLFSQLGEADSFRQWRFWSASLTPKLLAASGEISADQQANAERHQAERDYFKLALRGQSSYQAVISRTTGKACLNIAEPVFRDARQMSPMQRDDASIMKKRTPTKSVSPADLSGVIVMCIPLEYIGQDTGLTDLFSDSRLGLLASDDKSDFLASSRPLDSAVILVSNSGQLLFPDAEDGHGRLPSIEDIKRSRWPALHPLAETAKRGEEIFATFEQGGRRYFALTSKVDSAWSLVLLLNEGKALREIDRLGHLQTLIGALTLAVLLLIVAARARAITKPISIAGDALSRISRGDFAISLGPQYDDEVGGLLANIQTAADRLSAYLKETLSFAVTEKQLETAKLIQKDFLLSELPTAKEYQIEAFSRPALEIGADWYDVVDSSGHIFFLVADVCDKGVPSALYMSVFRSLIRSNLLDSSSSLLGGAAGSDLGRLAASCIQSAITSTNDYMAANQNASMMFATVFVAAVCKTTGKMSYVSAGHESPVLLSATGQTLITEVGGPAIGLFGGTQYQVSEAVLQPGDSLVIYSDGLIDARDPEDHSWGLARLQTLLADASGLAASDLLNRLVDTVDGYMAGNAQFDDLTIMVFKWLGSSKE